MPENSMTGTVDRCVAASVLPTVENSLILLYVLYRVTAFMRMLRICLKGQRW